jgi:hypothetical protein
MMYRNMEIKFLESFDEKQTTEENLGGKWILQLG